MLLQQAELGFVARVDVRLYPVELQILERKAPELGDDLGHVAVPPVRAPEREPDLRTSVARIERKERAGTPITANSKG